MLLVKIYALEDDIELVMNTGKPWWKKKCGYKLDKGESYIFDWTYCGIREDMYVRVGGVLMPLKEYGHYKVVDYEPMPLY